MPSILFVCVHNACRSQISEAIAKSLVPKSWIVASAGSRPSADVDLKAVKILGENNLKMSSLKPKGFADLPKQEWDFVVGMGCDRVRGPAVRRVDEEVVGTEGGNRGDICDQAGAPTKWVGAEMVEARQSGNRPYVPAKKFIEWDVADPYDGPTSLYEALFENLNRRVHQLIEEIKNPVS